MGCQVLLLMLINSPIGVSRNNNKILYPNDADILYTKKRYRKKSLSFSFDSLDRSTSRFPCRARRVPAGGR